MKIDKLMINSFGALKDTEFELKNGVTLFEGPNEAGKSTIGAFVKFMFFGLSSKADGMAVSERKKYQSWENDRAAGSIEFTAAGKRYRIDRTVSSLGKSGTEFVKVTDLETGEECLENEDVGMHFFGVNGDVFSQTAYVRQSDGSRINGVTVLNAIENMLFSGDENIDAEKVCTDLDNLRSTILYNNKKGGILYEIGVEKDRVSKKLDEAREQNAQLISLENKIKNCKNEIAGNEDKLNSVNETLGAFEAKRELEKFEMLDRSKSELGKANKSLDKYKASVSKNDFIPDQAYLDEITGLDGEFEKLSADMRSATDERAKLGGDKIDSEDLKLIEKYQVDGEEADLREFFENLRRSARLNKILGVFFIVFSVLWGALGAALIFVKQLSDLELAGLKMQYFGYIGFGVALVMILLAAVFFVLSHNANKKTDKKIESYGVTSEEDIYTTAASAFKRAAEQEIYVDKLKDCDQRCSMIEFDLLQSEEKIRSAAAKWGIEITDGYTVRDLIKDAGETVRNIEKHELTVQAAQDKYDSLKSLTQDLNRKRSQKAYNTVDPEKLTPEAEKQALEERDAVTAKIAELKDLLMAYNLNSTAIAAVARDTSELLDELYGVSVRYDDLYRLYNALGSASEMIKNASLDLRNEVSPRLSLQAGEFMRKVTGGDHFGLSVSSDLSIKYGTSGAGVSYAARESDYMSEGTRDIAYISLRLALIGFLYKKELPPLVFDESFSRLDDDRLSGVFTVINEYAKQGNQAFIFTSQKRDEKILGKISDFNYIKIGR